MSIYEDYGKLVIQAKILNGQIAECERLIAEEMNKPKAQPVEVPKEPKKE